MVFYGVMNITATNNQISYTGRCSQIRDAQWVIHALKSNYPHFSSSRIKPKMSDIYERVRTAGIPYSDIVNKRVPPDTLNGKLLRLCSWHRNFVQKCSRIRQNNQVSGVCDRRIFYNIIKQLEKSGFGNCGEDSFVSAVILKMNKVKNVFVAKLKADENLVDHSICIFNADGTKFDGKFKKSTIIVDSWLGQADFAHNLFVTYKNRCSKFFPEIKRDSNIGIDKLREIILSNEDILLLNLDFDKLIFPEISHSFMK